jgi:hypothetical protein
VKKLKPVTISGTFNTEPTTKHPFDDRTEVKVSAGLLYVLICNAAIAQGSFDGSEDARASTIMAGSVSIPEAKRILIEQAGWARYRW